MPRPSEAQIADFYAVIGRAERCHPSPIDRPTPRSPAGSRTPGPRPFGPPTERPARFDMGANTKLVPACAVSTTGGGVGRLPGEGDAPLVDMVADLIGPNVNITTAS